MNKMTKLPLLLLGASLALPTALLAQEAPRPPAPQPPSTMDHGAMPGDDMHGMTNMMGQMSKMMENCNQMMQSSNDQKSSTPNAEKTPAK